MRKLVAVAVALLTALSLSVSARTASAAASPTLTVYRDQYGVPHVEASDLQGVAYGTGYVTATDRLLEMDFIRRLAEGKLSELLGDLELSSDQYIRREYVNTAAIEAQYQALDPHMRSLFAAYSQGVNDGAAVTFGNPATRPELYSALGVTSFTPWTPEDSVAIDMEFTMVTFGGEGAAGELDNTLLLQKLDAKYGSSVGLRLFNELFPPTFADAPTVIPSGDGPVDPGGGGGGGPAYAVNTPSAAQQALLSIPGVSQVAAQRAGYLQNVQAALRSFHIPVPHIGSFAAAVSGAHSASGGGLLLGSPQSGLMSPPIFYEVGAHIAGVMSCEGFTVPGLGPALGVGWCNQHAWTLVAGNEGDQADLYVEKLNPANAHQYWFNGAWRDMTPVPTTYHVNSDLPLCPVPGSGSPFGPCTPHDVNETDYYTVHGFVFSSDTKNNLAFAYKRAQTGVFLRSLYGALGWNTATDFASFQAATDSFTATYNLIYADSSGNIAYRFTGLQPVRPGVDRRFPMPGTGEAEWTGFLNQCQMPNDKNPARGYFAVNQGIESKPISWWPNSSAIDVGVQARLAHDQQLLAGLNNAGMKDLAAVDKPYLEGDDPFAATWYPLFAHAISTTPAGDPMAAQLQSALSFLDQWKAAGFARSDANNDGKEDHPALSIFETDNFVQGDGSATGGPWPALIGTQLVNQLAALMFGNTTDHLTGTLLGQESAVYDALTGRTSAVHVADVDGFVRQAIEAVITVDSGSAAPYGFGTSDMSQWLRPYPSQTFAAIGEGTFTSQVPGFPASPIPPPVKGFDHGSYSQVIDTGAAGENVEPPGNVAHDSTPDQQQESAYIASGGVTPPPPNWNDQHDLYQSYQFKPMLMTHAQYAANPQQTLTLSDGGAFGSDTSLVLPPADSCRASVAVTVGEFPVAPVGAGLLVALGAFTASWLVRRRVRTRLPTR